MAEKLASQRAHRPIDNSWWLAAPTLQRAIEHQGVALQASICYQLGDAVLQVSADDPALLGTFTQLYGDCAVSAPVAPNQPEVRCAIIVLAAEGRHACGDGRSHRARDGGAMILTVKERGQFVATMRYIQVWLMETLAAWVPTTPEMEVKLLFGEHIWDVAQHADALGKRTFELRMPLQHSLRPADSYVHFLAELAAIGPTPQRITAVYDVLLPALSARYRRYLAETDSLSDAPTVRILERHLADTARMIEASRALRQELPSLQLTDGEWAKALQAREAVVDRLVATPAETVEVEV